jgi:hypothetical protein
MPRIMMMTERVGAGTVVKIRGNLTSRRAGGRRLARAKIAIPGLDLGRLIINRPKKVKRTRELATTIAR